MDRFKFLIRIFCLAGIVLLANACKKDKNEKEAHGWVTAYSGVTIGAQDNTTYGNFFKPQTGETVYLSDVEGEQPYLALMFYWIYSSNAYMTFPGDAEEQYNYAIEDEISVIAGDDNGVAYWEAKDLVTGLVKSTTITATMFNNLKSDLTWDNFNDLFMEYNSDDYDLDYDGNAALNPDAGDVFLLQFNGIVRAILYVKNVKITKTGYLLFDIIVEGHDDYSGLDGAEYIQPPEE